jgi:predicted dehydrogenase
MSSSERVGTAVVGYGYWGVNLARNVAAASSLHLVGVADPDEDRRKAAAGNHPSATTWSNLDAVLDDPEVDAVILAVPAHAHATLATQVLEAGRHVLVEKPLAMDVEEGRDLVALADDKGLVTMVGHTFLYASPVHRLKEYVQSGDLGTIQYLYSQRLSLGRIRRDCSALWNFGPHDISIMLHLLEERPTEVTARGFSFIGEGIDDVVFGSLAFPSGVGANLHVSWIDPRKTRLMTVVGDEKMVIYNDVSADQKLWLVDSGVARDAEFGAYESVGDFQWRTRSGDIIIPRIEMVEPLLAEMNAFGEACVTGIPPLTDARHGLDVVEVLVALEQSALVGGAPVEVPPR